MSFVVVSRAPLAQIEGFKKRMEWTFPWVSSFGSDFNYDSAVSFTKEDEQAWQVLYNYVVGPYMVDELAGANFSLVGGKKSSTPTPPMVLDSIC